MFLFCGGGGSGAKRETRETLQRREIRGCGRYAIRVMFSSRKETARTNENIYWGGGPLLMIKHAENIWRFMRKLRQGETHEDNK